MNPEDPFAQALSRFTFDAASGGAIRHLTDLGLTVRQIGERLSFPVPEARLRRAVWERLLETGVLLREEPGSAPPPAPAEYVREYNAYGSPRFRRIDAEPVRKPASPVSYRTRVYDAGRDGALLSLLGRLAAQSGEAQSYLACDFGLWPDGWETAGAFALLDTRQREYLSGLPWEKRRVYHRLDLRMREIAARLYEGGERRLCFYFVPAALKLLLPEAPPPV